MIVSEIDEHEDDIGSALLNKVDKRFRPYINVMKAHLTERFGTRSRKIGQRAARKVVDNIDNSTFGEQSLNQERTDEARSANNNSSHEPVLHRRTARTVEVLA
jgi:hypothetical protein